MRRRLLALALCAALVPAHGQGPIESKPGEIVEQSCLEFRAASRAIDVFDPQKKNAASGAGGVVGKDRRISVSEVEASRWARRETRCEAHRTEPGKLTWSVRP
jgi:hypothetical protein